MGIELDQIEDVIAGCVTQAGEQAANVGWPGDDRRANQLADHLHGDHPRADLNRAYLRVTGRYSTFPLAIIVLESGNRLPKPSFTWALLTIGWGSVTLPLTDAV